MKQKNGENRRNASDLHCYGRLSIMTAAMQRLLPIIIGSIGATGQAGILFHLLADCYPYKMMSQPPSEFYLVIAYVGGLASPIAAVTAAWWLSAKVKVISALPAVAAL